MKKYKWTIELSVSEQNSTLIPMLVDKNGVKNDDETYDEAVCRIVGHRLELVLKNQMIISPLTEYFGEQGSQVVSSIKESLDAGALQISHNIENIV